MQAPPEDTEKIESLGLTQQGHLESLLYQVSLEIQSDNHPPTWIRFLVAPFMIQVKVDIMEAFARHIQRTWRGFWVRACIHKFEVNIVKVQALYRRHSYRRDYPPLSPPSPILLPCGIPPLPPPQEGPISQDPQAQDPDASSPCVRKLVEKLERKMMTGMEE
ncbi:hypothetical protein TrCOL_g9192 [Triparma columacea]|uniref:Uncharacterized protein n=1 Tax=Triparma columacea TaxID=722753 RepID=A0A9W7G820_9STRA|nr:hypothetical protein TrCOL_g9192 [Triparma columacea]